MLLTLAFIIVGGVTGSLFGNFFIAVGCLGGWFISALERGVEDTKSNSPSTDKRNNEDEHLNEFSINSSFLDSSTDESSLDDNSGFDHSMAINDFTFSKTGLDDGLAINPESGLPMIQDSGLDVCGNVYGSSFHHDPFDDGFNFDSCFDSFDDNMCFNDDFWSI